jgi:hypothetical protein
MRLRVICIVIKHLNVVNLVILLNYPEKTLALYRAHDNIKDKLLK